MEYFILKPLPACYRGDVQLVGGMSAAEGTVEICNDNMWGTVCDTLWTPNDAKVICNLLGFPNCKCSQKILTSDCDNHNVVCEINLILYLVKTLCQLLVACFNDLIA